jgi:hypothetical protein
MTKTEATAEVFWTAFRGLPRQDQQAVLRRIVQSSRLRRDLMDLAVIEERRTEMLIPEQEKIYWQRLVELELIKGVRPLPTDEAPFAPIRVTGAPVSQTIIDERR